MVGWSLFFDDAISLLMPHGFVDANLVVVLLMPIVFLICMRT